MDNVGFSNVHVKSNDLRFQQIMINLISNAIKYSPAGTTVTTHVRVMTIQEAEDLASRALASGSTSLPPSKRENDLSKNVAVISVSDEGAGIPLDTSVSHIFEKFSQLSTHPQTAIGGGNQHAQPSGTGLGLNLCHKFVRRMNGNIWLSNNRDGPGATFSFYLDVTGGAKEPQVEPMRQDPPSPITILDSCAAHRFRVLVVDDTVINLKVLERMLLTRIGVGKVGVASSGRKAMEEMEQDDTYNLIFTDLQMPEMDGIEYTRRVFDNCRREGKAPPVIVGLTAEVSESVEERCLGAGMTQVLHKPITASQLEEFFDTAAFLTVPHAH